MSVVEAVLGSIVLVTAIFSVKERIYLYMTISGG